MRLSIRWKLILSIGLPLLATYALTVGITAGRLNRRAYEKMQSDMTDRVARYAGLVDGRLESLARVAETTAGLLAVADELTEEDLYALLRHNVSTSELIYGACIAFEPDAFSAGRHLFAPYVHRCDEGFCRRDLAESYDYTRPRWEWYAGTVRSGTSGWTEPYYDEGGGDILMCTYAAPFFREGRVRGVVTVDIPLPALQTSPHIREMVSGQFAIISRSGRFISHPNPAQIMSRTVQEAAAEFEGAVDVPAGQVASRMLSGRSGSMRFVSFTGSEPAWVFYAPITSAGWMLATTYPESELTRFMYEQLRLGMGMLIAGLLVIVCILLIASARISRPMIRLAGAVRELGAGNLDVGTVSVDYNDEIGDLARTFNTMLGRLREHVAALTRETAAREAVESELRVARQIQSSLLPRSFPPYPHRTEFALHAANAPARHVAGDFFDFFFVSPDRLLFIIADVSGKGVPAALLMAVTRTIVRNFAGTGMSIRQILAEANQTLSQDNPLSMFVTVFIGVYDTRTGEMVYTNAAHPPPYLLTAGGRIQPLPKPTGTLVGVFPDEIFQESTLQIGAGETLVLYTDGVTEAQSPSGELLGAERLEDLLGRYASLDVQGFCREVLEEVDRFQGGERHDDVTLLVLRRNT